MFDLAKKYAEDAYRSAVVFLDQINTEQASHCMCDACKGVAIHASDCSVHNEPAMRNGPCDCGRSEGRGMNDQQIEQEIQAKGLTAPRVTPADIEANIADVEFVKHVSKSGQVLRWAVITTQNGFAVVGKPSCAVSAKNDNVELGEKVALENSREELWPLMGYLLKERIYQLQPGRSPE